MEWSTFYCFERNKYRRIVELIKRKRRVFIVEVLSLIICFSFSDEKLDLNDSKWEDIHVITGALKMFFRELPEPLFTYNHFNDFVNAISKSCIWCLNKSCTIFKIILDIRRMF